MGVYTSSDGHQHGFLLNNGKYQTIDYPGSTETAARWINPSGEIVGEYTDTSGKIHGYILYKGQFVSFDYPSANSTTAFGVGANADIVGPYTTLPFTFHGFLLSKGQFSTMDFPGSYVGTSHHDCGTAYRRRVFRQHVYSPWLSARSR